MCKMIALRRISKHIAEIFVAVIFAFTLSTGFSRADNLISKLFSLIFVLVFVGLICLIVIWIMRYFGKLNKLVSSFGEDEFDRLLESSPVKISPYHYFLDDCLITLEIPAQIYYSDIMSISTRKVHITKTRRYRYDLLIKTHNGEKYLINRYSSGIFGDDSSDQNHFALLLETKNPRITRGTFPSSLEIFKNHFR